RYLVPSMIREDQDLPFGKLVIFTDGKSGWMSTPQGVQNMPAEILKQAQGEIFRQPISLILSDRDSTRQVNAVGDNAVELSGPSELVRLEFDSTGPPARRIFREAGSPGDTTEILSDWRDVSGIKMPFRIVVQENGMKTQEVTVSEYKFNTG